jgi:cellulose synthase/poly-beta-1,6-N-acetylglucosamine synthase-like glycosyltransferase
VLGLFSADEPRSAPAPLPRAEPRPVAALELTVIIPARNEELNLAACLDTLLAQDEKIFALGTDWELLVVDDHSEDRTRAIAEEYAAKHPGMRVLGAPDLQIRGADRVFTGKTNACWTGAEASQGRWILFTDADTRHEPGDLRRALHEADRNKVALLSYSPRQIVSGFAQRVLMPLIFSELASVYPPAKVNDPNERTAAANGQFLLVEREAYFSVGGHRTVGKSVLEDVALAWSIKRAKYAIRLRFAPDAISTHMYRGLGDMVEGWTKNLALLFPNSLRLALWRLLDIILLLLPLLIWLLPYLVMWQRVAILALWARTLIRFYQRVSRAHFPFLDAMLSPLGLPLFIYLLGVSYFRHKVLHTVVWKGREYRT